MQTGILVPNDEPDIPAFAERVESMGYHSLWVSELWTRDAFVVLTRAAEMTESITLGTAIVNVYGRSPATIAQAGATLDRAAGGRTILGLGTSTRKTIEDLHGTAFENPPRRLHETTELTKKFLHASGRVEYEGECFEVADFPALGADIPVYTAALGPANRRATGRTADGWLPHNIPFHRLDEAFETIAETAREAGREPSTIRTAPYVPAAVDEDPERAAAAIRGHLAYYIGNGEGYRRAAGLEYPDAADAVATAWREGDRDAARAAVTSEMIEGLAIAGTPQQAQEQLAGLSENEAIDEPLIVIPDGVDQNLKRRTVRTLAPDSD